MTSRRPTGSMGSRALTARDGLEVVVVDAPEAARVEGRVDDTVAAYVEYTLDDDHVVFVHTVTEPGWGGRGVASALAAGAIDLVRAAGRRVVPRCPFVADWIHRHPDALDLVDERHRRLVRAFVPPQRG